MSDAPTGCCGGAYRFRLEAGTAYTPDRKKVIEADNFVASERKCENSCWPFSPAPSQDNTTNCGGAAPAANAAGTGWWGWGPVYAVLPSPISPVPLLGEPAGGDDDGDPVGLPAPGAVPGPPGVPASEAEPGPLPGSAHAVATPSTAPAPAPSTTRRLTVFINITSVTCDDRGLPGNPSPRPTLRDVAWVRCH